MPGKALAPILALIHRHPLNPPWNRQRSRALSCLLRAQNAAFAACLSIGENHHRIAMRAANILIFGRSVAIGCKSGLSVAKLWEM